jgi:phospholipase/carboxylesterase
MNDTKSVLKAHGVPVKSMKRPGLRHEMDDDGVIAAGEFLTNLVVHKPVAKPNHHDEDHEREHH